MNTKDEIVAICYKLGKFCYEIAKGRYKMKNSFELMLHSYFNRMLSHLSSYLSLYRESKTDVLLITRSMIEGYALMHYADSHRDEIPDKWKRYSAISLYREMSVVEKKSYTGAKVDFNPIEKLIEETCSDFEVKKSRLKIKGVCYAEHWHSPKSITALVDELPDGFIRMAYADYSSWHHWAPHSFYSDHDFGPDGFVPKEHDSLDSSVVIMFAVFMNTVSLFFSYKNDSKALKILSRFEKELEPLFDKLLHHPQ